MSWKDYYPEGTDFDAFERYWGYDPDEDEEEEDEEDNEEEKEDE
jgi:hypothetical protein